MIYIRSLLATCRQFGLLNGCSHMNQTSIISYLESKQSIVINWNTGTSFCKSQYLNKNKPSKVIRTEFPYKIVNAVQARSHNTCYEITRKNYNSPEELCNRRLYFIMCHRFTVSVSQWQYRLILTTACLLSQCQRLIADLEAVLELIQPLDGDSRVIFKRPYFGRKRESESGMTDNNGAIVARHGHGQSRVQIGRYTGTSKILHE